MTNKTLRDYINLVENAQRESVAEGSSDTVYPTAQVIKSKNGKPIGEIYQDSDGTWGAFHYRADRGADGMDSREDAIEELRFIHSETGRSGPDYTLKGVAEGSDKPKPMVCKNCGKKQGEHRRGDCPRGRKTAIGYTDYGPGKFEPKEKKGVSEGIMDTIRGAAKEFTRDSLQKKIKQAWENTFWPKHVEPALNRIQINGQPFRKMVLGEPRMIENKRSQRAILKQYTVDIVFPIDPKQWAGDEIQYLEGQLRDIEDGSWNPKVHGLGLVSFDQPMKSFQYTRGETPDLVIPVRITSLDINRGLVGEQGVAEGSGKNVVKSVKVGNFRHDLVDTGFGWQVRIYNGDELYDTGMSKNSEQKGLAALDDAVAYTKKQLNIKEQGVAEGSESSLKSATMAAWNAVVKKHPEWISNYGSNAVKRTTKEIVRRHWENMDQDNIDGILFHIEHELQDLDEEQLEETSPDAVKKIEQLVRK